MKQLPDHRPVADTECPGAGHCLFSRQQRSTLLKNPKIPYREIGRLVCSPEPWGSLLMLPQTVPA